MSHRGQLEAFQPARYLDHPALGPLNPVRAGAKPRSPTTNEATTPAFRPKVLIYETLISFLKDACRTRIPGRNLSELARFQLTLDGYLVSMPSDSVVSGIVGSLKCRKILLELSSELGLDNDPSLRKALRTDGERIAALLVSIFDSQSAEDAVLRLEGDSAQCFLDAVLDILDSGFLITQEHSRRARRIIRKLSESCDKLPSALFITGVSEREEYPTFGGGYGDIYRASHNNKPVALKHMRHFLRGSELHRIRLKFCREALVWRDLHHPNILPFIGIDRESFPSSLSMVSPWMEHGTILKYLEVHGRANVDKLLFEIAQGLQYLHSRNIVHGDLRGANILINEDWSACLTDFGLSVFSNASSSMRTSTRAGSLYWMAPELIDPDRFGFKFARTPASDVYAFGCVCIEVYTGRPPFSELSEAAALLRTVNGERAGRPSGPPAMSDVLWQNVTAYWAEDRTARPSAEVVVQNMTPPALQKPLPPLPEVQSMPAGSDVSSTLPATAYAYSNVSEYLSSKPAISEDRPSPPFAVSRRKEQSVFPLRPVGGILNALKSVQPGQQLSPVLSSPEERLSENYVLDEKKKSKNFWGRERRDEENELTRKIGFLTATASEDWALVLDVCEHASANESNAKEAVRALRREFKDGEPAAQLSTARLWAIMLRNSSESFVSQSTSRKFLDTVEDLLTSSRTSPVVRERVMDVLAAAAYASGSKKDAGFRGLWRRVKPRDKPEEGMPFDTEDPMFNPPPVAHDYSTQSPPAGEDSDLTRNTGFLNMPLSGVPLSDYNPKSPPADEGKIGLLSGMPFDVMLLNPPLSSGSLSAHDYSINSAPVVTPTILDTPPVAEQSSRKMNNNRSPGEKDDGSDSEWPKPSAKALGKRKVAADPYDSEEEDLKALWRHYPVQHFVYDAAAEQTRQRIHEGRVEWKFRRAFTPTLPDELDITAGEAVHVLGQHNNGRVLCVNARGKQGLVPLECLELRAEVVDVSDLEVAPPPYEWRPIQPSEKALGKRKVLTNSEEDSEEDSKEEEGLEDSLEDGLETFRQLRLLTRRHDDEKNIIPPAEDMRRLFKECEIGIGNATLLSQALAMAPEDVGHPVITEYHKKCIDSQMLISKRIPYQENTPNSLSTREENHLVAANKKLLEALNLYDQRVAIQREWEDRRRKKVYPLTSHPQAPAPYGPRLPGEGLGGERNPYDGLSDLEEDSEGEDDLDELRLMHMDPAERTRHRIRDGHVEWRFIHEFIPSLQNPDELEIKVGEVVRVLFECSDGLALCVNARGKQGQVPLEHLELRAEVVDV